MPYDKNSSGLTAWPDDIPADCDELLLYANKIKKVDKAIGTLSKLTTLNLFNNVIGLSLPDEIGSLAELNEVNLAANKLAMLKDVHFASWGKVTILNLNDNNLSRMGSLAPLVALEELRLYGNQLEAFPTLSTHPELKIYEAHKNRVAEAPDDYFQATPALERVSIWGNQLKALPSSLCKCAKLVGVQAHENPELAALPDGPWPATLETLFIQDTKISKLPASLEQAALKRVNISKLPLDKDADELAEKMGKMILAKPDGIFWDKSGKQTKSSP